jgi:hypothetical protein
MVVIISLLEVIGGFGVLKRIATILFIIEMLCATLAVKLSKGL